MCRFLSIEVYAKNESVIFVDQFAINLLYTMALCLARANFKEKCREVLRHGICGSGILCDTEKQSVKGLTKPALSIYYDNNRLENRHTIYPAFLY
jgi:hypothetical protein